MNPNLKKPDMVTQMAERGAAIDEQAERVLDFMPGEQTVTVEEMARHYLTMNFQGRFDLFREIIVTEGPKGLATCGKIYDTATKLYRGEV